MQQSPKLWRKPMRVRISPPLPIINSGMKLTPIQEYNLMTSDMFDALPEEYITSHIGQEIIRYFCDRIKARFEKNDSASV